jgi:hypothetical protein
VFNERSFCLFDDDATTERELRLFVALLCLGGRYCLQDRDRYKVGDCLGKGDVMTASGPGADRNRFSAPMMLPRSRSGIACTDPYPAPRAKGVNRGHLSIAARRSVWHPEIPKANASRHRPSTFLKLEEWRFGSGRGFGVEVAQPDEDVARSRPPTRPDRTHAEIRSTTYHLDDHHRGCPAIRSFS